MLQKLKEHIIRLRTWIINVLFVAILSPDVIMVLIGANWGSVIPEPYINYVTIAIPILNIWMRPRPAVLPTDTEAKISKIVNEVTADSLKKKEEKIISDIKETVT